MFQPRHKTCILHIGMHKTGTSSIQEALNGYDKRGTFYANLGQPNHSVAIATIFRKNAESFWVHAARNLSADEVEAMRERFLSQLEMAVARRRKRMIISAESLSRQFTFLEIKDIAAWFQSRFDSVQAIGYVRDFDGYAASGYQEFVKHGTTNFMVQTPNYKRTFKPWIDYLGNENVIIAKYQGDTAQDFFQRFDLSPKLKAKIVSNVSLSGPAIALLLRYNREAGQIKGSANSVKEFQKVVDYLRGFGGPRFSFKRELLDQVRAEQAEDIYWIEEQAGFSVSDIQPETERPVDSLEDMLAYSDESMRLIDPAHPVGAHLLMVFERASAGGWKGQLAPEGTVPPSVQRSKPSLGQASERNKNIAVRAATGQGGDTPTVTFEETIPSLMRGLNVPLAGRPGLALLNDYAIRFAVPEGARELVISYEAADLTIRRGNLRRPGFGEAFLLENGYGVVSVLTGSPNWFRAPELQDFMADGQFHTFLKGFDKVHAYGSSMGGFGACTFAELLGVDNLVTFQPISTLIRELVPWEERFNAMHRLDWTGAYADATKGVSSVNVFYIFYDPGDPDANHVARFRDVVSRDVIREIKLPGAAHAVPRFLQTRGILKSATLMALQGMPVSEINSMVQDSKAPLIDEPKSIADKGVDV